MINAAIRVATALEMRQAVIGKQKTKLPRLMVISPGKLKGEGRTLAGRRNALNAMRANPTSTNSPFIDDASLV